METLPFGGDVALPLALATRAGRLRSARQDRVRNRLLAGMLFDGDGNRMTPTHAVKNDTRYRYMFPVR